MGLLDSVTSAVTGATSSSLTDNQTNLQSFLRQRQPDGRKWNQVYPYVLKIEKFPSSISQSIKSGVASLVKGAVTSKLSSLAPGILGATQPRIMSVTLPIAPQNISVTTPSAIETTVTLRGIVEEHNGAPLRMVRISGTTGITPFRDGRAKQAQVSTGNAIVDSLANELFANTIQAANKFVSAISPSQVGLVKSSLVTAGSADLQLTGFYFFHQLFQFVDQYLQAKKTKAAKDEYVVFDMQKDEIAYQCSIKNFSYVKRVGTLEYDYTLDLLAWGYTNSKSPTTTTNPISSLISNSKSVLATIQKARDIVAAGRNVIRAVSSDISRVTTISREVSLLVKDIAGIPLDLSDLGGTIIKLVTFDKSFWAGNNWQDAKAAILNAATVSGSNDRAARLRQVFGEDNPADNSKQSASGQTGAGVISTDAVRARFISYLNSADGDPDKNYDIFSALSVADLDIPDSVQTQINNEQDRVTNLTSAQWTERRELILEFRRKTAEFFGAGSTEYNSYLGVPPPTKTNGELTLSEAEILSGIDGVLAALDYSIVSTKNFDNAVANYVDFYAQQAIANGVPFNSPLSKFGIPFPSGTTLEALAAQYLGDSTRWIEIAALNGLKAPFTDEEGNSYPIKGSTSGKVITLSTADDLYINQPVILTAPTLLPVSAKIKKIDSVNEVTYLITLDQDVSGYSADVSADVQYFLPNTVNPGMFIYIPSTTAPQILAEDFRFAPSINEQDILAAVAGSDILLTSEGDIAVTPAGDIRNAVGQTNLVQAAILKLRTPRGSLIQHPDYGVGVTAGNPTGDVNPQDIQADLQQTFASDDRFAGILASQVTKNGPVVSVSVLLQPTNVDSVIPLNVNLRK